MSYFGATYRNALKEADASRNIAEKAKAAQEYYLAVVSHDLKTPLTSIILKSELIMRGGLETQKITGIYDCANQLKKMIDSLLDLSKLDSKQFALNSRDQNVQQLLDKVIEVLEPIAQKNQITLGISSSNDDWIYCDEGAMVRVLVNLVSNAIKFTPSGGSVLLISRQHLDRVIIEVSDTGVGISPENIPHVFDRYWQAKATARQGSGLGLAIVKGIVEVHGGKVWVESRIGQGSRFFVSMPRSKTRS
jgi:signal transduction histidine kinase